MRMCMGWFCLKYSKSCMVLLLIIVGRLNPYFFTLFGVFLFFRRILLRIYQLSPCNNSFDLPGMAIPRRRTSAAASCILQPEILHILAPASRRLRHRRQ